MRRIPLALLLAACFTDDAKTDAGSDAASDVYADAGIAGFFASSCALATCHVGPDSPMKLDLSPAVFEKNLVGVPAAELLDTLRVNPGWTTDTQSYLLCKVDPECGVVGDHMPLDGGLPADQIAMLRAWVGSLPPLDASVVVPGVDSSPPTFAGASSASAGPNAITLAWGAATDDVTAQNEIEYLVYEASSAGAEDFSTPTAITPAGATSFAIGKVPVSTTRFYVVRARDHAGNVDGNVAEVSATTPSTTDTTAPTFAGVTSAVAKSPGTVTLAWGVANDVVSLSAQITYAVYVAQTSGGETFTTPDAITVAGATSLDVSFLPAQTRSYFVVRARDQAGNEDVNVIEASALTPNATFALDVAAPFKTTCTTAGCHSGAHPAENIDVSYASLVNAKSDECTTMSIVAPSSPKTSYLVQKLRGWGSCFVGTRMPEQATPLTAAQIDSISAWIAKGAPND